LVTIAVPTYNRCSTFLPQAVEAARKQTYGNLEILIADNASTDGTQQWATSLADDRIVYHRHAENLGAAGNINFCIGASRGRYLLLLMDDDLIDPDFIECCISASRADTQAGLVRTGTRVVNLEGVPMYESPNRVAGLDFTEFVLAWLEGKTAPFLCSTLFRTEPLREIGMRSRHDLWSDVMSELPIAARHGRVDVPDVKATFRMHSGAITVGVDIARWCEDSQDLLELVCRLAPQDAERLRSRLVPFLATFNYRNAIRLSRPWPQRLAACVTVGRHFGRPPSGGDLLREALKQTRWLEDLRRAKRVLSRLRGG
jgi:glycosyltransferase involved in cell wall biosynthesis